jgi:hypothetical protein
MTGTAPFVKPYQLMVNFNGYQAIAKGTCTGTLDGKPYDGPASIYMDGRMNQPMSCEASAPVNVPGRLSFGREPDNIFNKELSFTWKLGPHAMSEIVFNALGAFKGNLAGRLSFLNTGQQTLEDCAADGIPKLDFDLTLQTADEMYG